MERKCRMEEGGEEEQWGSKERSEGGGRGGYSKEGGREVRGGGKGLFREGRFINLLFSSLSRTTRHKWRLFNRAQLQK